MGLNIKDLRISSPEFTNLERIPKRYTIESDRRTCYRASAAGWGLRSR